MLGFLRGFLVTIHTRGSSQSGSHLCHPEHELMELLSVSLQGFCHVFRALPQRLMGREQWVELHLGLSVLDFFLSISLKGKM